MDLNLKDKVALVTGASRGLGRAVAEALAAEGAAVMVVARPSEALGELERTLGERCGAFAGDLLDPSVPQAAVAATLARFGRLDVAIVNSPGPRTVQPMDATEADFASAFETAFYPAVRLVQAVAPPMARGRWGRIIIVSSTSVKAPKPFLCLSAAARSALWAWAKTAAPRLYEDGITVNAIFAGPHDTDRARALGVTRKAIGQPHDFGRFVASLCTDATGFVTGSGFVVDGGEMTGI